MLVRKKIAMVAALIAMPTLCPLSAKAQTVVYPAHLVEVVTGWNSDDVTIQTDVPSVNPANCPYAGYYVSPADTPGNRSHLAAALTALANKMTVTVVVSNTQCTPNGHVLLWSVAPSWP